MKRKETKLAEVLLPCKQCKGQAVVGSASASKSGIEVVISCACDAETVVGPISWAIREWNRIHAARIHATFTDEKVVIVPIKKRRQRWAKSTI